jgi:hypothetical protein
VRRCKCPLSDYRSNLPHSLRPAYARAEMHSISWLALMVFALGCASQSSDADRQLREQEARIKRLTATCDRLVERVSALETVGKTGPVGSRLDTHVSSQRPDLPMVKVTPDRPEAEPTSNVEAPPDATPDDGRRVEIVGEGSRVEARTAGESTSAAPARPASKANSRASKANQGSLPKALNSGAQQ